MRGAHRHADSRDADRQLRQAEHLLALVAHLGFLAAPPVGIEGAHLRHDVARQWAWKDRRRRLRRTRDEGPFVRGQFVEPRPAGPAGGLIGCEANGLEAGDVANRSQCGAKNDRGAVCDREKPMLGSHRVPVNLRNDQRHTALHAERGAIVDDDGASCEQSRRILFARIFAAGKENDVKAAQRFVRCRADVQPVATKAHGSGAIARGKRVKLRNRNVALLEHLHDRFADGAGRADDGDVHAFSPKTPNPRPRSPRRCTTARTAASMPATNDSRLNESCRIVSSSPVPPSSTS